MANFVLGLDASSKGNKLSEYYTECTLAHVAPLRPDIVHLNVEEARPGREESHRGFLYASESGKCIKNIGVLLDMADLTSSDPREHKNSLKGCVG